jgi:hypothetical protein
MRIYVQKICLLCSNSDPLTRQAGLFNVLYHNYITQLYDILFRVFHPLPI